MKRHAHWWITLLAVLTVFYDLAVWGALADMAEVGDKLRLSARRQAFLATVYMAGGEVLDRRLPPLRDWGAARVESALAQSLPRIRQDPYVAMDVILGSTQNGAQALLQFCYFAAPITALLALLAWAGRPKKVHLLGRR